MRFPLKSNSVISRSVEGNHAWVFDLGGAAAHAVRYEMRGCARWGSDTTKGLLGGGMGFGSRFGSFDLPCDVSDV